MAYKLLSFLERPSNEEQKRINEETARAMTREPQPPPVVSPMPAPSPPQAPSPDTPALEQQASSGVKLPPAHIPAPAASPAPVPVVHQEQQQQPPPRVSQTQTETIQPFAETPEIHAARERRDAAEKEHIKQLALANQAQADANDFAAAIAQKAQAQAAKQDAINQAEAQKIQEDTKRAYDDWQKKRDELKANEQVDPNRYAKSLGVGGGIVSAISQALGAFGSSLSGGTNQASKIISDAIDHDIRAQEQAIEGRRHDVSEAYNAVQHYEQMGMNRASAQRAARADLWEKTAQRIQAEIAPYKNAQALAQGQALIEVAKAQAEASGISELQSQQGRVVSKTMTAPAAQPSVEDQIRINGLKVDVPQADPNTGKPTGTMTYTAKSEDDVKKIKAALTVREAIRSNLQALNEGIKGWQSIPGTTSNREVTAIADDLRTQFAVLRGLGALSEKDYKIASQVGNPTDLFQTDNQTRKLAAGLDRRLDKMIEAELKGRGLIH